MALPFYPHWGFHNQDLTANSKPVQRRRMVCIGNMLGFYPPAFWPELSAKAMTEG